MTTQANDSSVIRILAIGLQPKEAETAKKFAQQAGAKISGAKDDMELMAQVRTGRYSMVIMGQVKDSIDPAYLVWLLKGFIPYSNLVLIFNTLDQDDKKQMHAHGANNILMRPCEPQDLISLFEAALTEKEDRPGTGFIQSLMNWIPFLSHRNAA